MLRRFVDSGLRRIDLLKHSFAATIVPGLSFWFPEACENSAAATVSRLGAMPPSGSLSYWFGAASCMSYNRPGSSLSELRCPQVRRQSMPRALIECIAVLLLVVTAASGCTTIDQNPKTAVGGLGGAAFGGLIAAAAGGGGGGHRRRR